MSSSSPKIKTINGTFLEVLKVALPLILSSSCHAINMFVDRLMLSRHSQEAVSAAFTGGLTNFTLSCLFVGLISYTGTFVAQYEGAKHREMIGKVVWHGVYLAIIGGILMFTGTFWSRSLFSLFGHAPNVLEQEIAYFGVTSKGTIVFLLGIAFSTFWSGRGKTALVMIVAAIITLCNIPLNYMLIFGNSLIPGSGATGAALGTIIAEGIGLFIYVILFFKKSTRTKFYTLNCKFDFDLFKRMFKFGLPSGIHLALDLFSFNLFTLLLGCYGAAVHEATSITFGINSIAYCPVLGIGTAASILVGQAIGAENIPLAKKSVRNSLIIVQAYTLFIFILFTFFQDLILAPFVRPGDQAQVETLVNAKYMLYFISTYLFFDGFNICLAHAIRGAGDTKFPMWVMGICGGLFFALPCYIFYYLKVHWYSLWITMIVYIIILCFVFIVRYLGGKWTKMRVIEVSAIKEDI
jgi:MATE family multidrug resistance protein